MATNTFNVNEFNSIYSMIEENSGKITVKSNQIASLCEQLSQILNSTDSNLSSSYLKVSEAFRMAKSKVIDLLHQLELEMKSYESQTLANEAETDVELKEINSNMEDIANIFNSIANKNG